MSLEETIREDFVDEVAGPCQLVLSFEMLQDMVFATVQYKSKSADFTEEEIKEWASVFDQFDYGPVLGKVMTPEITEDEVIEWSGAYAWLDKLDIEKIKEKYKVRLEREPDEEDGWMW